MKLLQLMACTAMFALVACSSQDAPVHGHVIVMGEPPVSDGLCGQEDPKVCDANIAQFREEWPKAWKGDYAAQRNMAYTMGTFTPGVRTNPVQGCAWRMVILASGDSRIDKTDTANYDLDCGRVSSSEFAAARSLAANLVATISGSDLPSLPLPNTK